MTLLKKGSEVNLFTPFREVADLEKAEYLILARLREIWDCFLDCELYPHLSDLVEFRRHMRHVIKNSSRDPETEIPDDIGMVSSHQREVIWDTVRKLSDTQRRELFWLIDHLLGEVKKVMNDAKKVQRGAFRNVFVQKIGDFSLDHENLLNGWIFGYDGTDPPMFCLYGYELTVWGGTNRKCSFDLEWKEMDRKNIEEYPSLKEPGSSRRVIIEKYPHLHNFPAYAIEDTSDKPLPFDSTVLPVGMTLLRQKLESYHR